MQSMFSSPTESVRSVRHDDVKTVLQSLCDRVAIRRRRHRIPFASQNQNRHI